MAEVRITKYYETYNKSDWPLGSISLYVIEDGGKVYNVRTEYRGEI